MNILHLSMQYPPMWGGIETFVCGLSEEMQARGHSVQVLACQSFIDLPEADDFRGVRVNRIPIAEGVDQKNPRLLLQSLQRTRKVVQDFQPDVVHVHIGGPILSVYAMCPELQALPMIASVHDLPKGDAQESPSIIKILQHARTVITNAQIRHEETLNWVPNEREKVKLCYVSKPPFPDSGPVERSIHPLVLMVGRQVYKKGFDLAIEAFTQVQHAHPEARLVLVGDGEEHEALKALVQDRGLADSITFTGRIPENELATWYKKAWLNLIPSRHSESFGLVSLEAMRAGCVMIGSRTGGIPEVIEDGVSGLLFENGSVDELAQTIKQLIQDPQGLREMRRAGEERAKRLFDWPACADTYEEAYRTAVQ